MSNGLPGQQRPRRFRMRRGARYPSPTFRTGAGLSTRYDGAVSPLTRRGLLGGALVLIGAGIADLVHVLGKSSPARTNGSPARFPTKLLGLPGTSTPHGTPGTTAARPAVTHHHEHVHGRTAPHSHQHSHSHGHHHPTHSHGTHHTASHHHTGGHAARNTKKKQENVTLPPARLAVRSSPAYQVDQLIPKPPKHAIALTIDDGPDPQWTPHVLRLLDHYRMQASFCIVGEHAAAYPWLVRDIARAGHVIVNHSYTHVQPFNQLTEKRIVWEITKTQHAIEKAARITPLLFRAPGGDWSHFIYRAIASYGLEPLDWDVDPRDWALPGTKAIERRLLRARPGEIVLCHDGGGNRAETVRALRTVLPKWKRRGYLPIPLHIQPHWLASTTSSPSPTPTSDPTS